MDTNVQVYGLIFACPLAKDNLNCPFREIRWLPAAKRFEIVNGLSRDELLKLEMHHVLCFRTKGDEILNPKVIQ